jgi:hypothetical protein
VNKQHSDLTFKNLLTISNFESYVDALVARALSSGVNRLDPESDHSPLFSAEVNNELSYTSSAFMVRSVIKDRDNLNCLHTQI